MILAIGFVYKNVDHTPEMGMLKLVVVEGQKKMAYATKERNWL